MTSLSRLPERNEPPRVDAGPDQSLALPGSGQLRGTVSDDGLPNPPGTVTSMWSQISGPEEVTFDAATAENTRAFFSLPGAYVLRLTVSDGELTSFDDVSISVTRLPDVPASELNVRVAASSDDAEERKTEVILISTDIDLVIDSGAATTFTNLAVGLRFSGITIPQGATILNAYVQFTADEVHYDAVWLMVQGEAVDNPLTFATSRYNISSRPTTTAAVAWTPEIWTTVGEAGDNQRTPNIAEVIHEIVNRSGWRSNNSLVLLITGSGQLVAVAYDGSPAAAPLLHIEYKVTA